MNITSSDIKSFKELYRKHFNLIIDDKSAHRKLALLVRQMELVYQPITKEQLQKLNNEDENDRQHKELLSA